MSNLGFENLSATATVLLFVEHHTNDAGTNVQKDTIGSLAIAPRREHQTAARARIPQGSGGDGPQTNATTMQANENPLKVYIIVRSPAALVVKINNRYVKTLLPLCSWSSLRAGHIVRLILRLCHGLVYVVFQGSRFSRGHVVRKTNALRNFVRF
jgi:hypothetical protein